MKNKIITNIKSFFKSAIDNKVLFERRKNSFLAPFLIFVLAICMMTLPTYFNSKRVENEDIMKNFPEISKPMEYLLTSSLECHVENKQLTCDENAKQINTVIGEDIKYTIIANQKTISANIEVIYSDPKDTDNFIMLLNNYVRLRYVQRDHVNQQVISYEILGDYSEFEGFSFEETASKIASNPDSLNAEIENFVLTTYKSTIDTQLIVNLSNSLLSFTLFVFVSSFILKWPTLFKRKKGFKYSECLKLSLTSSFPALITGAVIFLLLGFDFTLLYGIIYIVRIFFIYFKYFFSSKNNIYNQLYLETNEERFKLQ